MKLAELMNSFKLNADVATATVATPATDNREGLSSVAKVACVAVAVSADKVTETSRRWLVDTSDRGTVRVTCHPPHTLTEILEAVPEAVSAVPLPEVES